jgi:hypothetical protein
VNDAERIIRLTGSEFSGAIDTYRILKIIAASRQHSSTESKHLTINFRSLALAVGVSAARNCRAALVRFLSATDCIRDLNSTKILARELSGVR